MRHISSESEVNQSHLSWLNAILNSQEKQIEKLGNGLAYCLLLHYYFPNLIPMKRICLIPRRHSDNINNLLCLSQALASLKWTHIIFNINKVSTYSYNDNLQLLIKLRYALTKIQAPVNKNLVEPLNNNHGILNKKIQPQNPNQINNAYTINNFSQISKDFNQLPQLQIFHLGLATPMKNPIKNQVSILDSIKSVVSTKETTDREKVRSLKLLLSIQIEDSKLNEQDEKDLLSDESKKESAIIIDDP